MNRRGFLKSLVAFGAFCAVPAIATVKLAKYTFAHVNVLWFGAKGDGQTDDRAAIQRAIDEAAKLNVPVYFPKGIYNLKEPR